MVQCAACRVEVDEFDTYFSDLGTVCEECHTNEEARDREEFHRGEDQGSDFLNSKIVTRNESYIDEDGRHVTVTSTVDFGIFTWLYKVIKALLSK